MAVKKYEGIVVIEIDEDKCDGDGECAAVCPVDVFDIVDGKSHATRVDDCIECCACVDACHVKAIKHNTC
ncbi:MAG: 4Fe-4S binding protein [Candidatus Methanoperedens sp.]|jgi:NAD-dependent dihydropyrimidine dehydrogenase PreA subunit|nr:4Fe-4S binding protein [Candidatus Methanoperedens sp.]PKL53039.1 MAG: 4Fe-4S ferredoxin [Candidatus Methanoperedenaceae archaeon HGW-Methanoperedenaceae-1]